ncbi:MAG TPA: hypothetical protein VFI31_03195 [Pirellulales bacterium]|nr:hypothetical protein [Pirellulales bacterium]
MRGVYRADCLEARTSALEQALVEFELFLAWLPVRRSHLELASLKSGPRRPLFIEKVKAAVEPAASATFDVNGNRIGVL